MLSRFHLIPERYGQTDRFAISISRVSVLLRDKNENNLLVIICLVTLNKRRLTMIVGFQQSLSDFVTCLFNLF